MAETQSTETPSTQNPTPVTSPNKKGVADFEFLEVIGKGAFGEVKKAREKSNGRIFAAKMLNKNFIVESGKKKYVHTERNIFNLMNHPNIVKLYFTFQDPKTLYYLLELCPNGSLQTYLKQFGKFPEDCVRFYAAEIVNALEHMHSKGVIHRDLKPDNVLLDPGFHSKLTDFGTSKELGTDSRARSDSFCGTEEFVPPELLDTEEPYCTKSSDLWALGVMIFLMLCGKPPFKGQTSFLTFELIKKRDFTFSSEFSEHSQDLINKLLVMNPNERLGAAEGGYQALKSHPFFTGIDWETVHTQTPPAFGVLLPVLEKNNNNVEEVKKEEKKEEKKETPAPAPQPAPASPTPAPQPATPTSTTPSKSDKKEKKSKKEKEEKKKEKKEKKEKEPKEKKEKKKGWFG